MSSVNANHMKTAFEAFNGRAEGQNTCWIGSCLPRLRLRNDIQQPYPGFLDVVPPSTEVKSYTKSPSHWKAWGPPSV